MSESVTCSAARVLLDRLMVAKREYFKVYKQASLEEEGFIDRARWAREEVEQGLDALQELFYPSEVERVFNLRQQYESQVRILQENGLLQSEHRSTPSGEIEEVYFIRGIDGNVYPLPSLLQIFQHIAHREELGTVKADQGFKKLVLVPFALPLDSFSKSMSEYLIRKNLPGRKSSFLNLQTPFNMYIFDNEQQQEIANLDQKGKILYYPEEYSFNQNRSHGKSKQSILLDESSRNHWSAGWNILLVEEGDQGIGVRVTPDSADGVVKGEVIPRRNIEGDNSPAQCLQKLKDGGNGQFRHESGMTIEDWIMTFITHGEETEQLLDGHLTLQVLSKSASFLTGAMYIGLVDGASRALVTRCDVVGGRYSFAIQTLNIEGKNFENSTARHVVRV